MADALVLSIDQGTTSTRSIVFDDQFAIVGQGQEEFEQHFPNSGWVEHNPKDLLATVISTCKKALNDAKIKVSTIEDDLRKMLIPKDPDDPKNIVMELRAGTGGDEASIFAGDLFRMYTKYAEKKGWNVNLVDFNEGTAGGYKEIIFEVNGEDVYGTMKLSLIHI